MADKVVTDGLSKHGLSNIPLFIYSKSTISWSLSDSIHLIQLLMMIIKKCHQIFFLKFFPWKNCTVNK